MSIFSASYRIKATQVSLLANAMPALCHGSPPGSARVRVAYLPMSSSIMSRTVTHMPHMCAHTLAKYNTKREVGHLQSGG